MPYQPFVGPSYVFPTLNFDCQRSINWYPSSSKLQTSKRPDLMLATPGLKTAVTLPTQPLQGLYTCQNRLFAVSGQTFYEIKQNGNYVSYGSMPFSNPVVSMADNGINGGQIAIVGGNYGYIFNFVQNTLNVISSSGWVGADTVCFSNGFFIFNNTGTNDFSISNEYDGTQIDPLAFGSVTTFSNNIIGVAVVHQNIWCLGSEGVEIEYDSGNANFPFTLLQGINIKYGCASPFAIVNAANTLFWLGADQDGGGIVWMANGYNPQRVSTEPIENYLSQYSANFAQAVAFTYQENGHVFYVLNIPGMPTTVVYDATMDQWHERAWFNYTFGQYQRALPQCHAYCFGQHYVGDYSSGNVYIQSSNYTSDNGNLTRRQRTAPHVSNDEVFIFFNYLQMVMETGVGLDGNAASQDAIPQVMLRWSNDGGHSWSDQRVWSAGKIGQTKARVRFPRLGRARDRVWEVVTATQARMNIIGAELDAAPGSS